MSSIDPGFPHSNASLGTVGWDINTGELIDPNEYKDLMGYCSPIWVSDYTWHHLSERTAALNQPVEMERSAPGLRWQHYAVELDGSVVTVGEPMERERVPRGQLIDVKLVDARGTRTVEAHWFPSDHLDTGSLILPTDARFGPDTQVVLD